MAGRASITYKTGAFSVPVHQQLPSLAAVQRHIAQDAAVHVPLAVLVVDLRYFRQHTVFAVLLYLVSGGMIYFLFLNYTWSL